MSARFEIGVGRVAPVLTGVFPPELAIRARPWLNNIARHLLERQPALVEEVYSRMMNRLLHGKLD
jgi:hypothetical protein